MRLEVKNLSKVYRQRKSTYPAVDNVSFDVSDGDFTAVTGHSGSGKSTLLNLIAGLLIPTSGEIVLDGENVAGLPDREMSQLRSSVTGYIPQGQTLLSNLTVYDNIRLPYYLSHRKGNPDVYAKEIMSYLGIDGLAHRYPGSLSGGETRRAEIARALISKPSLLLADEPTDSLDPDNTARIVSLFENIAKEGIAVIMVTHDINTIKFSGKVYVMDKGKLVRKTDTKL